MRYRPHRGGLADSVALTVEVDGRAGLINHLRGELGPWTGTALMPDTVRITAYGGDDDRIGWKNVHIVTIDGYGVMGFCEGPAT
jgi:hypothetical protein